MRYLEGRPRAAAATLALALALLAPQRSTAATGTAASASPPRAVDQPLELALITRSAPTKMIVVRPRPREAPRPQATLPRDWIENDAALEEAWRRGELVRIPIDAASGGLRLRLHGPGAIGEHLDDARRQPRFCGLRPSAAALLYTLAERLRGRLGDRFDALEITSLVRTWTYQRQLARVNPDADPSRGGRRPAHVRGLAFDLALAPLSSVERIALEGELAALAEERRLHWVHEPRQRAIHVAIDDEHIPAWEAVWEQRFAARARSAGDGLAAAQDEDASEAVAPEKRK
jgi:hypothetical protein